jgi:hypothetical protein
MDIAKSARLTHYSGQRQIFSGSHSPDLGACYRVLAKRERSRVGNSAKPYHWGNAPMSQLMNLAPIAQRFTDKTKIMSMSPTARTRVSGASLWSDLFNALTCAVGEYVSKWWYRIRQCNELMTLSEDESNDFLRWRRCSADAGLPGRRLDQPEPLTGLCSREAALILADAYTCVP